MWQSTVRILLVLALGYGLFRAAPVVTPPVREIFDNSGINQGIILGKATDYVNNLLGNEVEDTKDEVGEEINNVVGDLVSKTKEVVGDKVQEDVDKVKESVKDTANEQFCKSVLKTLEEECG